MSFASEYDLISQEFSSALNKQRNYVKKLEKKLTEFDSEVHDLKIEIRDLTEKITDLSNELVSKNQTIQDLQHQLKRQGPVQLGSRDFNALNIRMNELRKENDSLQRTIGQQKHTNRQGLSVKQEINNRNVLSMLQTSSNHKDDGMHDQSHHFEGDNESQELGILPDPTSVKIEDKENIIPTNSQETSSDKFETTQPPEEQASNEEEFGYLDESKDPYQPTFDIRRSKPIIQESILLKSKSFDLPSSSPDLGVESEIAEKEDVTEAYDDVTSYELPSSSPLKDRTSKDRPVDIKKEISSSQIYEIEDSQDPIDDLRFNKNPPTPHTDVKKFRTPALRKPSTKRAFQLHTPIDSETPMKKRGLIGKSSISPSKSKRLDLTYNPDENRNWAIEDFKVNPSQNQNIDYAYQVVVRGKDRSCIHGTTCDNCKEFYKAAGDVVDFQQWGPQWNDKDSNTKKFDIVKKTSRHKDLWQRPESPPGFGHFDFPSTQEQIELRKKSDLLIRRTAYERLLSALHDKKYLFRKDKYNKVVEKGGFVVDESILYEYLRRD